MSKTLNLQPPVAAYISTKPIHADVPPATADVPAGYVLQKEKKSKRLNLLIRPNTFRQISELAESAGISVNEAINCLLEKAVADPGSLLSSDSEHR